MSKHKDEGWLREQYDQNGLTVQEIADKTSVHRNTVTYWMDKFDIDRNSHPSSLDPHRDEIVERYEDGESTYEIADDFDKDGSTVLRFLKKQGVEIRSNGEAQRVKHGEFVPVNLDSNNYERWHDQIAGAQVYVHQLLAIAEGADPSDVFSDAEYVVHHKNEIRWDNRPDNIEVLANSAHAETHGLGKATQST